MRSTTRSTLRHRVVMFLVATAAAAVTTTSAAAPASAEIICTAGTNWDSTTMSCR